MNGLGDLMQFWIFLPFRVIMFCSGKFRAAFCPWDKDPFDYLDKDERP